jgi:MOSC domain-containing protein YiiM
MMQIISINVAMPKTVEINGGSVLTAIYKEPVANSVWLGKLGLTGDGQADLTVHGGEHQAVYSYPYEHYQHWQNRLNTTPLRLGTFGENFTVSGLFESEICVGDILSIGEAMVQVTMPRIPCFKFGHKISHPEILDEFLRSGKSGFYQRVLTEGYVKVGDQINLVARDTNQISIRTALGLQKLDEGDATLLEQALKIQSLAPLLKDIFEKRLSAR